MQKSRVIADKYLTMKTFLLVFLFVFSLPAHSQEFEVQSHYPSSALVMNRLLPFSIIGGDIREITEVIILSGSSSCSSMVDPSHKAVFLIFCMESSLVDVEIKLEDSSGESQTLNLSSLIVFRSREPGQTLTPSFREPGDDS